MRFCNKEVVRAAIEGKVVALVGSGPGVLSNEIGLVDSHEVVVRVNNYKLFPETGFRTDIHYSFYGSSIRKTAVELQNDGVKLCMCKCPDAQFTESAWHTRRRKLNGVDFRYIYRQRAGFWFCPTYVPTLPEFMAHFELLGKHVPTTGFGAMLDILSYRPKRLFMTGFDFFQSGTHNVNERWRAGDPSDPIGHDPAAEHAWFVRNARALPLTMDAALTAALEKAWLAPPLPPSGPRHRRQQQREKYLADRRARRGKV